MIRRFWQALWACVWETSESTGIPLGHAAPWVFAQMLGVKGERVD